MIYYNEAVDRPEVLEDWEEHLLLHSELRQNDIRRTEFTLTFVYDGVPFDITAVRNMAFMSNSQADVEMRQMVQVGGTMNVER